MDMTVIRLGFDARMIMHSGIGTYIRGLLGEFGHDNNLDLTLYGDTEKTADVSAKKISASFPIYSLREQFLFPALLKRNQECNLHVPHYNAPIGFRGNLVVTVHDLIHLRYPASRIAYFYARAMLTAVCRKAKAIIAVSEATKKDLMEMLGVDEIKITVVYHGVGVAEIHSPQNFQTGGLSPLGEEGKYLLYVGMLKPHKNIKVLIEAFLKAKQEINDLKLVIAGKNFMVNYTEQFKDRKGIQFLGEIPHKRLKQLYRGARIFIFPSLYEGFGFPPLEAMSHGIPVICSNAASLTEVTGCAAALFDPEDTLALANWICKLWEDRSKREAMVKKGFEQSQKFSWQICAQETFKIYQGCFS